MSTCRVDGRPFFPIGCWLYSLDTDVMADLHEHRFNTVLGNGIKPADLPLIEKHGLMCIPMASDEWFAAAKDSPALLAWYLIDEPEEHGTPPEDVRRLYDALKAKDGSHPISITHNQLAGPPKYKGSCDLTMTDVYPVTRKRDWPLSAVGAYTDGPRQVHGPGWPNFTIVQTFGGAETDGGLWAQPLPHEVRYMVFNALVHRANGICYFSYWPRAPLTWAAIAEINRDVERIVPWLITAGEERAARSADPAVEVRARRVGDGWLVIATNGSPQEAVTRLTVDGLNDRPLRPVGTLGEATEARAGQWAEHFAAFEVKVYTTGLTPPWPTTGPSNARK